MAKGKRHVVSGTPRSLGEDVSEDEAKRAANRERVAAGKTKRSRQVSKDPRVADSKRDRWKSRNRMLKAVAEGREVKKGEAPQRSPHATSDRVLPADERWPRFKPVAPETLEARRKDDELKRNARRRREADADERS